MPDCVSEDDEVKLLWDMNIQCDHVIEARRLDIVVVPKQEKKCAIIDIAVSGDKRMGQRRIRRLECVRNLRWPVPIYMRVGYVFDSRFSE